MEGQKYAEMNITMSHVHIVPKGEKQ